MSTRRARALSMGDEPVAAATITAAVCAGVLDACLVLLRGYRFQGGRVVPSQAFYEWMTAQAETSDHEQDPFFRSTYVGPLWDPLVGFLCHIDVLKTEVECLRNEVLELQARPRAELAIAIVKTLEDAACFARETARDLAIADSSSPEGTIH